MPGSFDFISTEDKPALIAFSTPEWLETAESNMLAEANDLFPPGVLEHRHLFHRHLISTTMGRCATCASPRASMTNGTRLYCGRGCYNGIPAVDADDDDVTLDDDGYVM